MLERMGPSPDEMGISVNKKSTVPESRRFDLGSKLMRESTRGPFDTFLEKRADWMLDQVGLIPLMEKKVWPDNTYPRHVDVLCLGAGKGHEMEKIHEKLPGSMVQGVDPHDHYAPEVWNRVKERGSDVIYLHESMRAEDLNEIEDYSQDAVTLFFVLHHIATEKHEKVFAEVNRVLKPDGYVFVAEDLVGNANERAITKTIDKRLNLELRDGPHAYRDLSDWEKFFAEHGFEIVHEREVKPDKVRHGFFALQRRKSE